MKNIYMVDLSYAQGALILGGYEKSIPSLDLLLLSPLQQHFLLSKVLLFTAEKMKLDQGGRVIFKPIIAEAWEPRGLGASV